MRHRMKFAIAAVGFLGDETQTSFTEKYTRGSSLKVDAPDGAKLDVMSTSTFDQNLSPLTK